MNEDFPTVILQKSRSKHFLSTTINIDIDTEAYMRAMS